jgi:hypothetical protein
VYVLDVDARHREWADGIDLGRELQELVYWY